MEKKAFLFDLDGVIMDTEGQYTEFWNKIGAEYIGDPNLAEKLKGEAVATSLARTFPDEKLREEARRKLYAFETEMNYSYIPGAFDFLTLLREKGLPTAIVTSSNLVKMANVYKSRPELPHLVDRVLTPEDFKASKPAPDCFILGAEICGVAPSAAYIFEDSINGLKAAKAAGGIVVGLTTTNSSEVVGRFADIIMSDFTQIPETILSNISYI